MKLDKKSKQSLEQEIYTLYNEKEKAICESILSKCTTENFIREAKDFKKVPESYYPIVNHISFSPKDEKEIDKILEGVRNTGGTIQYTSVGSRYIPLIGCGWIKKKIRVPVIDLEKTYRDSFVAKFNSDIDLSELKEYFEKRKKIVDVIATFSGIQTVAQLEKLYPGIQELAPKTFNLIKASTSTSLIKSVDVSKLKP